MTLLDRVEAIKAHMLATTEGPSVPLNCGVICNGCGRSIMAATPEQLLFLLPGWEIGPNLGDDDFCPECR